MRKAGKKALIATYPMSSVDRARERGETQGFNSCVSLQEATFILAGIGARLWCAYPATGLSPRTRVLLTVALARFP